MGALGPLGALFCWLGFVFVVVAAVVSLVVGGVRVTVRVRGGPTLTLTSNKPMSTSRASHSSQSSMRIHRCQSIQAFLPTLPSQSFHTNNTGQYSQSIRQSQASSDT